MLSQGYSDLHASGDLLQEMKQVHDTGFFFPASTENFDPVSAGAHDHAMFPVDGIFFL